ncbi:hypothetical protein DY000_02052206 [Brassica cretica]|uniref:No apical meristem-associated C-terminal domain-containing protein n=1 Tax=Brassica cretica TaxID=69181 RepID=A0ABQ7AJ53_BRACR|nr:hypothetical protein DY000_02052206 [Brassica cretica]
MRSTTTLLRASPPASPPASVVLSVRRPLETTTNDDCVGLASSQPSNITGLLASFELSTEAPPPESSSSNQFEDVGQEASSQATTNGDHPAKRHVGVKAAKGGGGKRPMGDQLSASEFQGMWSLKEKDLAAKERLKKMGLLESLIAKKEPLSQFEEALRDKLITEMGNKEMEMITRSQERAGSQEMDQTRWKSRDGTMCVCLCHM